MTNSTFPVSYKDPVYAAADQAASQAAGIPPGLLTSIRVAGEKSNADQTSSAGATTPYQFTPATRQLVIKKYGIDPTASPEAAAMGAAYLLKEGIQRTGSAAGAVTQYIGGTDPSNWGGQTRAYTNRVMANFVKGGGQDAPQPDAQPLPSAASYGLDPSVVGFAGGAQAAPAPVSVAAPQAASPGANVNQQIITDYNSGRLSPEDMSAVDQRVASGALKIDPAQLQAPAPTSPDANAGAPSSGSPPSPAQPKPIGPQTLAAMQAGTLTPDQQAAIKTGLANGTLTMPAQAPQQPTEPEETSGWNPFGGVPASAMPTAPSQVVPASQSGSTLSDVAEKSVGNIAGSLLDIASAGGRLVGATDFANGAQQAHQQINAKMAADTNNSTFGKVAGFVGSAVPYAAMGGASLPGAMAGGAVAGAAPAIAENKSLGEVARDTAVGAGAGAAGFGIGKAAGGIASSIAENPTIAKAIEKAKSLFGMSPSEGNAVAQAGGVRDAQDAADIAAASGQSPGQLATKLEAAPAPQTPGYTPTAAEMAQDANVTTVQKANTNAQPAVAANASANNDAAIAQSLNSQSTPNNPGTPAAPQAADQAAEAAAQKSDALAAQGQTELPPLSTDAANTLQADQFQSPIKLAKKIASDDGSTVFEDHQAARQADAANTLQQIIGTPDELNALKATRSQQASEALNQIFASGNDTDARPVIRTIDSILDGPSGKRPAVQSSLNSVRNMLIDPTTATLEADPNVLYNSVRKGIGDMMDSKMATANPAGIQATKQLLEVQKSLDNAIENGAPGFKKYLADYSDASNPINAMESAQQRLYSAVNPATGEIAPTKLVNAINSIKAEQMKAGAKAADSVPPETIDALATLAQHLQNKNDLTGLPAEGQEYIRRALASSDKHAAAHQEFQRTLNASPAYAELHGPHAAHLATVESAQGSQSALFKAQELIDNADSVGSLKALDKILPDMEAADKAKAIALRQAKARELAMHEVVERGKGAAGQVEFNRNTFKTAADKYSPYMSSNDATQFGKVATDLHNQTVSYAKTGKISGSDTDMNRNLGRRLGANIGDAIKDRAVQAMVGASVGSAAGLGGATAGALVGVIAPAVMKTITQKVSNITGENAAKLLSNGKLLAAALRNYESLAARRLFIEKLSAKVGYAAGAGAVNQFNSRR